MTLFLILLVGVVLWLALMLAYIERKQRQARLDDAHSARIEAELAAALPPRATRCPVPPDVLTWPEWRWRAMTPEDYDAGVETGGASATAQGKDYLPPRFRPVTPYMVREVKAHWARRAVAATFIEKVRVEQDLAAQHRVSPDTIGDILRGAYDYLQ